MVMYPCASFSISLYIHAGFCVFLLIKPDEYLYVVSGIFYVCFVYQPAGPHMNIDYRVRERILTLAKSGKLKSFYVHRIFRVVY